MRHYGLYLVVALGVAIWFGRNWFAKESSRRLWERWMLQAPVIGPLAAQIAMARFCRMLGTLLGAGVSLITALVRRAAFAWLPNPRSISSPIPPSA